MKKWNSTIKQIKDLNYDEKFVIKNLSADKRILEMHREGLSKILFRGKDKASIQLVD